MAEPSGEHNPTDTAAESYARRLQTKQQVWWKLLFNVQAPYRWNLRRQHLGRTLDVGCGIGRNLKTLGEGSIGVDHNAAAIVMARELGVEAVTTDEWATSDLRRVGSFEGMLLAHVIEHMDEPTAIAMMDEYLPYLRSGGKVFFVCPQERGFASDPTHVRFTDGLALSTLARRVGLQPQQWFSFPFPRWAGQAFIYNEFCLLATKP